MRFKGEGRMPPSAAWVNGGKPVTRVPSVSHPGTFVTGFPPFTRPGGTPGLLPDDSVPPFLPVSPFPPCLL